MDNRANDLKDWSVPLPESVPVLTVWPAVLALGACFAAWGVLTSWLVCAAGGVLFIAGCVGWIADLRGGKRL